MSRRRRCIAGCPETPPSRPSHLPSSSNGNRRGAEGWRDPGEGGEGRWRNMAERSRGSVHHGEGERAPVAGQGRISGSPLWAARCRAGPGGRAAAVADTARPRIRHPLPHHTCSGNPLWTWRTCGVRVCWPRLCLWTHTHTHAHTARGEARQLCVLGVSPAMSTLVCKLVQSSGSRCSPWSCWGRLSWLLGFSSQMINCNHYNFPVSVGKKHRNDHQLCSMRTLFIYIKCR